MSDLSDEDIRRKKHLQMEQLSYDGDAKRVDRDLAAIDIELRRYEADMERLKATIEDVQVKRDQHMKKREFLISESERIRRTLMNLR